MGSWLAFANMKFSIEEILKKDDTPKGPINIGFPTYLRCDSDSGASFDMNRNHSTDLSSTESTGSDLSDDVFADSHDLHSRKRIRTVITRQHKAKLELIYRANPYQSRPDLLKIGRDFGLPQHVVKIWFQNRRAKSRRQGYHSIEPQHPSRPQSSSSSCSSDSSVFYGNKPFSDINEFYTTSGSLPCRKGCCYPPQRPERRSSSVCSCTECTEHDKRQVRVHYINERQRQPELLSNSIKPTNASFCRKLPFCCCLNCRLGTIYVKY